MDAFHSYLRRAAGALWAKGYGDEVCRAALVAPMLVLIGFAAAWFCPQLSEVYLRFYSISLDTASLADASAQELASLIFVNNALAAFSALLWGLVPYAELTALPLGVNFFMLGALGAHYCQSGEGAAAYLVGILPHGIFELPALVLFCAAGLHLCSCVSLRLSGDKSISLLRTLSELSRLYLCIVIPLLLLSAIVEAYITPQLLALVV